MGAIPWTDDQLDLLKKYHGENRPFSIIAHLINAETGSQFTKNSCIGKAGRVGLEQRRVRNKGGRPKFAANRDRSSTQRVRSRKPTEAGAQERYEKALGRLEAIQSPDHLGIAFFDLQRAHCRFMKGEGLDGTYCGQPVNGETHWCAFHHTLVYRPPEARPVRRAA